MPHAENGQNLSISRMGTDIMSHHDKTTAHLLNLMNLIPHAENGQNLSISRMGTDMMSHHDKTTADLLNLVNFDTSCGKWTESVYFPHGYGYDVSS